MSFLIVKDINVVARIVDLWGEEAKLAIRDAITNQVFSNLDGRLKKLENPPPEYLKAIVDVAMSCFPIVNKAAFDGMSKFALCAYEVAKEAVKQAPAIAKQVRSARSVGASFNQISSKIISLWSEQVQTTKGRLKRSGQYTWQQSARQFKKFDLDPDNKVKMAHFCLAMVLMRNFPRRYWGVKRPKQDDVTTWETHFFESKIQQDLSRLAAAFAKKTRKKIKDSKYYPALKGVFGSMSHAQMTSTYNPWETMDKPVLGARLTYLQAFRKYQDAHSVLFFQPA